MPLHIHVDAITKQKRWSERAQRVRVGMPIGLFKNKNLEHNKIVYRQNNDRLTEM